MKLDKASSMAATTTFPKAHTQHPASSAMVEQAKLSDLLDYTVAPPTNVRT